MAGMYLWATLEMKGKQQRLLIKRAGCIQGTLESLIWYSLMNLMHVFKQYIHVFKQYIYASLLCCFVCWYIDFSM